MKSKHNKNINNKNKIPNTNLPKNITKKNYKFNRNRKETLFINLNKISSTFISLNKNIHLKLLQLIFLFCFTSLFQLTDSKAKKHICGTDLLKTPKRILIPEEDQINSSSASKTIFKRLHNHNKEWEPLRIHFDFSYISEKVSEGIIKQSDLVDLQQKIMPKAQEVFQSLLLVKPIKNKLKLNSPHCEMFPIPDLFNSAGDGVEADIVIFVLIDTSGFFSENGIEAAAIHCLQHQETRRPIAGYIQFKSDLNINSQFSKDYYAWLAIHEISHILVINRALYEDYIDPETLAPLGYESVIGSKVLESGTKMNFIKTPKVMEKAKEHFKCDKLYGLPLEYNGGPGTAGSHWAKRYMNGDYMIGESFGENLISEISLALFEDSGWYKVNWKMANLFLWGKGKGCDFFDRNKKCLYADKAEFNEQKLNNTLFNFVLNEKGKNLSGNYLNTSINNAFINKEHLNVKDNIYKNDVTKERISLKVLRKKANDKIKSLKITSKINKNRISNNANYNTTNTNNITDVNNIKNNDDTIHSSVKAIFESHKQFNKSISTKKFILEYKTDFKDEFCTEFNMPVCSTSHLFRGSCTVDDPYDQLEKHEMLFKNTRISGFEKLTDRCPTAIESRYKQASYGGSCRYGERFPNTKSFEKICPECACFMSNLRETKNKNYIKKNFRLNNQNQNIKFNQNKGDIVNYSKNSVTKNLTEINNFSTAENFLKKNNDNAHYENINVFDKKNNNQINYSFKEQNDSNEKIEEEEADEFQEEYEIINLNPSLKPEDFVASCFEFKCEKGELFVLLNDSKFKCEEDGKITHIPGYEGGIRCPNKSVLCDERYLCKFGCVERFNNAIAWEKFDEETKN